MRRPPPRCRFLGRPDCDAGTTLVELTVYIVILGLVLTAVTGFFIAFLRSSNEIKVSTQALDMATVSLAGVERGVRNADQLAVTGGTTLLLRTYTIAGAPTCTGWYYDATNRVLRSKSVANPVGSTISLGSRTNWTQMVPDVIQTGSTPVFALAGSNLLTTTFTVSPTGGTATSLSSVVAPLTATTTSTSTAGTCAL